MNTLVKPVKLLLHNFKLIDTDGNRYGIHEDEIKKRELFGENCIKNSVLNTNNPEALGIIAFDAPMNIKIAYIQYQIDNKRYVRKIFPKE